MIEKRFGIKDAVVFDTPFPNFPPLITLLSPEASCQIALHGAQVLSYKPHHSPDLLWMNPLAYHDKTKAIRGGIPLCFPWFASLGSPAHGFARVAQFEVLASGLDEKNNPHITLQLQDSKATRAVWDFSFEARLYVKLSQKLELQFCVENQDNKPFSFTEALHSYFHISDVADVRVEGFEGSLYHDSLQEGKTSIQREAIMIEQEIDRIYMHQQHAYIKDEGFNRTIEIEKEGSQQSVVWNPWIEKSSKMPDMPKEGYRHMLCVESANIQHPITLLPGEKHTMKLSIHET